MYVPLTPIRFLYRAVDLFGTKVGVVCGARRFTYAEFGERVERLAAGLLSEGAGPGDRVAFLSFNNHQLLEGYYAAPLIRAIAMPLNVRLAPAELAAILAHAEPRLLIYEPDFAPLVRELRGPWRPIEIGDSYEALLGHGRVPRPDLFSIDEAEIAELFYTSGSTGAPKGVMLAHRTLYLHAIGMAACFAREDDTVNLHTIPLYHANGWGHPQVSTMYGHRQVMVRRFEPAGVLRLIQEERGTVISLVPTMANALLNCAELPAFDTSSLRNIYLGGAASSPELIARLERAFRCEVFGSYGLTETSPVATSARDKSTLEKGSSLLADEERWRRRAMTGWPVPGCEARVVDAAMDDVPRDMCAVGEVAIRGDLVMDGYYKDPDATAAAMSHGWLLTGDMAVWDTEGYIQIVDRKKDIIVSGGENISSIEVERAIAAHPAVLECAVVAAPDPEWGETPAAIVVLKPEQQLTAAELREFLAGRIARFKLPRRVEFAEGPLPKSGTGKIAKRELRKMFR